MTTSGIFPSTNASKSTACSPCFTRASPASASWDFRGCVPEYLLTIAAKFTKLQIICAHFGNPWYAEAAEVARWCKNVHCDITGSTLIKLQGNLKQLKDYLWWEGPTAHSAPDAVPAFEKLVFGTDEAPERLDNMLGRYEDMFDACQIPEEIRKKVYGSTLARLMGIPVRA
jgi:uncharacterized protein